MKFKQLIMRAAATMPVLHGILNSDCEREIRDMFLQLKYTSDGYEVDDWQLGRLRDNSRLGWPIKNQKIFCKLEDICLVQKIEVGGMDGGNCWGGEAESYSHHNALLAPFAALDSLLLAVCPDLTYAAFLEMKKQGIVQEVEYTITEYYGNSTDLVYRFVRLKALFDFLRASGCIQESV